MINKKKIALLAAILSITALTGCGGGSSDEGVPPDVSGGDDNGGETVTPDPTDPSEANQNEAAKRLVNAPEYMSGKNIVVAVADSGVHFQHEQFDGTALDARSNALASEIDKDTGLYTLFTSLQDDYRPDDDGNIPYATGAHGTAVSSLIFGKEMGLISDGTLLALDIMYTGSISKGDYNPEGTIPDLNAALLGVKKLISDGTGNVDFINLSISGVGEYLKPSESGPAGKVVRQAVLGSDTAVIAAAGNKKLDFTEIYASDTPECTTEENEKATGYDLHRCYALKFSRHKYTFIPYNDDTLRDYYVFAVAVDNQGTLAEISNIPGANEKIQKRFISAPGVQLNTATHKGYPDRTATGTSYAAPIITAAAAGVKSKFPSLSSKAVIQSLLDTADNTFDGYSPELHGVGILDIEAALNINPVDYLTN